MLEIMLCLLIIRMINAWKRKPLAWTQCTIDRSVPFLTNNSCIVKRGIGSTNFSLQLIDLLLQYPSKLMILANSRISLCSHSQNTCSAVCSYFAKSTCILISFGHLFEVMLYKAMTNKQVRESA